MSRRLATFRSMSRPSTLTRIVSPISTCQPFGQAGVERDQRRAVVVGRPPLAGDELRAVRRRRGVGQAAVAAAAPRRCRASPRPGRPARRSPRRSGRAAIGTCWMSSTPGEARTICSNRASWSFWMSTKKKLGALAGQLLQDLAADIALDQRHRGERRQAQPDRHQQQRRGVAGAVQVGDAQPDPGRGEARRQPGQPHHRDAAEPEQHQGRQRRAAEIQREAPVGRRGDGQRRPGPSASAALTAIRRCGRHGALRQQRVAEQRRAGDARRAARAATARSTARSAARSTAASSSGPG